jgi:hypothetical protein
LVRGFVDVKGEFLSIADREFFGINIFSIRIWTIVGLVNDLDVLWAQDELIALVCPLAFDVYFLLLALQVHLVRLLVKQYANVAGEGVAAMVVRSIRSGSNIGDYELPDPHAKKWARFLIGGDATLQ